MFLRFGVETLCRLMACSPPTQDEEKASLSQESRSAPYSRLDSRAAKSSAKTVVCFASRRVRGHTCTTVAASNCDTEHIRNMLGLKRRPAPSGMFGATCLAVL